MNNKIKCSAKQVQDYIRTKDQYESRIKAFRSKVESAEQQLSDAKRGLERIKLTFIKDAVQYPDQEFTGVFSDGENGFVHVTVLKAGQHGRKNHLLSVEKVIQ